MTDYVDSRIESQGVDLYRHDGIPPLAYWKSNDEPGRHGISEMKHVEAYSTIGTHFGSETLCCESIFVPEVAAGMNWKR